jgi:two-component system nitrate/nitrite response regulator NarL
MTRPIRLQILHRSRLFRDCLEAAFSEDERFEVLPAGQPDPDPTYQGDMSPPHVLLVDLGLPDRLAVELVRDIPGRSGNTKIIVLAPAVAEEVLFECMAAGAHGCVLETSSVEDLQDAIERIHRGEMYYSPGIVDLVFRRLTGAGEEAVFGRPRAESSDLTRRELQIVHHIAENLSNKQIARRLHISLHTVKNHVHNIIEKLHVQNRFHAVEYARRRRWLDDR